MNTYNTSKKKTFTVRASTVNCAAKWGNGGNLYGACLNLNGIFGTDEGLKFVSWRGFHVDKDPVAALL